MFLYLSFSIIFSADFSSIPGVCKENTQLNCQMDHLLQLRLISYRNIRKRTLYYIVLRFEGCVGELFRECKYPISVLT